MSGWVHFAAFFVYGLYVYWLGRMRGRADQLAPLPRTSVDNLRTRIAARLANYVLRLASPQYRAFVKNSIRLGIKSATDEETRA